MARYLIASIVWLMLRFGRCVRRFDTTVRITSRSSAPCRIDTDIGASLGDYMHLPVDQYALIKLPHNAKLVRVFSEEENLFELTVPTVRFFQLKVLPVVFCKVSQRDNAVFITSDKCFLSGSDYIDNVINKCFIFDVRTWVTYTDKPRMKTIHSLTEILVKVDPPPPFNLIPRDVLEATGNFAMAAATQQIEQGFLQSLAADYNRCAIDSKYRESRSISPTSRTYHLSP